MSQSFTSLEFEAFIWYNVYRKRESFCAPSFLSPCLAIFSVCLEFLQCPCIVARCVAHKIGTKCTVSHPVKDPLCKQLLIRKSLRQLHNLPVGSLKHLLCLLQRSVLMLFPEKHIHLPVCLPGIRFRQKRLRLPPLV